MSVLVGTIDAWDPQLGRGRVLSDGPPRYFHFTLPDYFADAGAVPRAGQRVDFQPAPGVRTRIARQVRVIPDVLTRPTDA